MPQPHHMVGQAYPVLRVVWGGRLLGRAVPAGPCGRSQGQRYLLEGQLSAPQASGSRLYSLFLFPKLPGKRVFPKAKVFSSKVRVPAVQKGKVARSMVMCLGSRLYGVGMSYAHCTASPRKLIARVSVFIPQPAKTHLLP